MRLNISLIVNKFFARGQRAFKLVLKLIKSVRNRREEREKEKRGEEGQEEEQGKIENGRERMAAKMMLGGAAGSYYLRSGQKRR